MHTVHIPHDFPRADARRILHQMENLRICTTRCHDETLSFFITTKNETKVSQALRYLSEWEAQGVHVFADDDTKPLKSYVHVSTAAKGRGAPTAPPISKSPVIAPPGSYYPNQLAAIYGILPTTTPKPCNIAIIELGGGYRPQDLTAYWKKIGLTAPFPTVNAISVNGATNSPGQSADTEVVLDIQVIGGVCPSANMDVYFAPNTFSAFYNAISMAVNKTNGQGKPYYCAVSISWGGPESIWGTANLKAFDALFALAVIKNIAVFVASGDNGSSDGQSGLNVDFPASSPNVIACGGTNLTASGTTYISETAWTGAGGGYSGFFARPAHQSKLVGTQPKRMVPDISGVADPNSGVIICLNGSCQQVGGTSMVAPMWAALYCNSGCPPGYPAKLYTLPSSQFHDVLSGSNGAYRAGTGYDPVTGLGTPRGLLSA